MNAPKKWQQFILVEERSLQRLIRCANLHVSDPNNAVVLRGIGEYFPAMEGPDWAAGCFPLREPETGLDDMRSVLDALISVSFLITTYAPRRDVEVFMRSAP
jgi:hypothetical protein